MADLMAWSQAGRQSTGLPPALLLVFELFKERTAQPDG
jgi:hypothetical protein